MAKKSKTRESLEAILASCSDTLFPAEMGKATVTLNSRDVEGDTPLHVMLWRENTYGALLMIAEGADVNAVGDMSETPLHSAVRRADVQVVAALLKAGANPAVVSEFGQTPKDMAKEIGGAVLDCFQAP
jgi:ankyrin repeat protein